MTTLPEALDTIRRHGATYAGEARLVRWGDTSSAGMTVTFELHPEEAYAQHPFRHCGVQKMRYTLIAVPIADTDEEHPKPQEPVVEPPTVEEKPKRAWRDISRSQQAGIKCSDPEFQRWVATARLHLPPADVTPAVAAAMAATFVRNFCGINTRAELDRDIAAANRWDMLLTEYEIATGRLARP